MKRRGNAGARLPFDLRTLCILAGVGLAGPVVAVLAMILWGGYHPETYPGGIDLVLAGLRWFFFWAAILIGVFAAFAVRTWLTHRHPRSLIDAVAWTGFTIATLAVLAVVVTMRGPGEHVVPIPIRVFLYVGIGLMVAAFVPALIQGLNDAWKRGNRIAVGLALILVAMFVIGLIQRL